MISFLNNWPERPESDHCNLTEGESVKAQTVATPAVGEVAQDMSDELREARIKELSDEFLLAWARWEDAGCFAARGDAERLMRLRDELVRGRSAAQVAKLERGLGLA